MKKAEKDKSAKIDSKENNWIHAMTPTGSYIFTIQGSGLENTR